MYSMLVAMGLRDSDAYGTSPLKIQKGIREPAAEVMDAELEGEEQINPFERQRVAEPLPFQTPPEVQHEMRRGDFSQP